MDRIDLRIDVPAVTARDLSDPGQRETSSQVAARVADARERQLHRYTGGDNHMTGRSARQQAGQGQMARATVNARVSQSEIEKQISLDDAAQQLLAQAADQAELSARGYFRVLRVARTIADLAASDEVRRPHLAEALGYRGFEPGIRVAA